ncbi:hypothetical protein H6G76_24545 [Nostoc sp. FACHB-152]|uniref:hypothetical protein n=1 Tax=unclassified Nostoc TaxID=2593658 RepID=UPI0016872B17|nr:MULTISPECIES: hypothetical protein [unclassified Nostoc]MBD2450272.1 hypothetical protein [Nostoc sp. FACHB-152]MBD2471452.1 hypothetical protein [Nostoc sp. FACHB-145]
MKQYSFTLLVLLLSAVSNFMVIPCQAQTASDSKINTTNNISSEKVSTNDNRESQVSNADNSANGKSTVISENTEKTSPVSANKANSRIPIGSRIFATASMEQ